MGWGRLGLVCCGLWAQWLYTSSLLETMEAWNSNTLLGLARPGFLGLWCLCFLGDLGFSDLRKAWDCPSRTLSGKVWPSGPPCPHLGSLSRLLPVSR